MLRGRRRECEVLAGLLEGVRGGRSGVLVVRGEAGVGKTALLDYAVEWALDLKVLRAVGVESEMELAFAALHQVCGPMLDRLEGLPGPQRAALGTAFGLQAGPAPDRVLVGMAALRLLSQACEMVTRGSCAVRWSGGRWMSGCGTRSWLRRGGTRWRYWSCRAGSRRRSWRAALGCRMCCRCRAGSRRASCGGSRACPRRPGCCWWSRRPTRSAIPRWCGARPGSWS